MRYKLILHCFGLILFFSTFFFYLLFNQPNYDLSSYKDLPISKIPVIKAGTKFFGASLLENMNIKTGLFKDKNCPKHCHFMDDETVIFKTKVDITLLHARDLKEKTLNEVNYASNMNALGTKVLYSLESPLYTPLKGYNKDFIITYQSNLYGISRKYDDFDPISTETNSTDVWNDEQPTSDLHRIDNDDEIDSTATSEDDIREAESESEKFHSIVQITDATGNDADDKQIQEIVVSAKQDSNGMTKFTCPVCEMIHEFKGNLENVKLFVQLLLELIFGIVEIPLKLVQNDVQNPTTIFDSLKKSIHKRPIINIPRSNGSKTQAHCNHMLNKLPNDSFLVAQWTENGEMKFKPILLKQFLTGEILTGGKSYEHYKCLADITEKITTTFGSKRKGDIFDNFDDGWLDEEPPMAPTPRKVSRTEDASTTKSTKSAAATAVKDLNDTYFLPPTPATATALELEKVKLNDSNKTPITRGGLSLVAQLQANGFVRHPVHGDGNCLYYSIAYALDGRIDNHAKLRQDAVTYMINNPTEFEDLITATEGMTFDQYIKDQKSLQPSESTKKPALPKIIDTPKRPSSTAETPMESATRQRPRRPPPPPPIEDSSDSSKIDSASDSIFKKKSAPKSKTAKQRKATKKRPKPSKPTKKNYRTAKPKTKKENATRKKPSMSPDIFDQDSLDDDVTTSKYKKPRISKHYPTTYDHLFPKYDIFDPAVSPEAKAATVSPSDPDDVKLIKLLQYVCYCHTSLPACCYIYVLDGEITYGGFTVEPLGRQRLHLHNGTRGQMILVLQNVFIAAAKDFESILLYFLKIVKNINLDNKVTEIGTTTYFKRALYDAQHPSHSTLTNATELLINRAIFDPKALVTSNFTINQPLQYVSISSDFDQEINDKQNVIEKLDYLHDTNIYARTGIVYALLDKDEYENFLKSTTTKKLKIVSIG